MPRRADRLFLRPLGPREAEALDLVAARPGMTLAELASALAVSQNRARQIVARLELGRVRRERDGR